MQKSDISSKPVSSGPAARCASARKSSAACGDSSAASAVTCAAGSGCSFITAAVMIPSVPSAPMNRSRRS
jgi:hypothetical protein